MRVESPAEQLFFSTVRIEVERPKGTAKGTGFIFSHQTERESGTDAHYPFIVTNRHVVEGAISAKFWFTQSDESNMPKIGKRFDVNIQNVEKNWHGHPSPEIDIAVIPLGPIVNAIRSSGSNVFFRQIPHTLIPTAEQLAQLDAIEEVTFIGYPNGMFDTVNLLPIARRGTTATPPQLNYGGRAAFLIDASVFPGSSGSPVFVLDSGGYSSRGNFVVGSRAYLLGVIARVFTTDQRGNIEIVPIPTGAELRVTTKQMIDVGLVFKSSTIVEAIEDKLRTEGIQLP